MKLWTLLFLPSFALAQEPTEREWQKFTARTYCEIVRFDLYQQPEGSDYPEWKVEPLYDSVILLRKPKELIYGFRPTGGYATRWTRFNFDCPVIEPRPKRPKKEASLTFFTEPIDSCRHVIIEQDTFYYSSTWSCYDPFCGSKHGHIQYQTETWIHPEFGTLASRHSPYGRPNQLSLFASKDPGWMNKLKLLVQELDWGYTEKQRRKMKSSIGILPEL